MAGQGKGKGKYQANKKDGKRVPAAQNRNKAVVLVCKEILKEVRISVDEERLTGLITFVTESDKHIKRILVCTALPPGIWTVKIDAKDIRMAEVVSGKQTGVDKALEDKVVQQQKAGSYLWLFRIEGDADTDQFVDCLLLSARGKEIKVSVSYYAAYAADGSAVDIPTKLLTDDYADALKQVAIAAQYLILLEHFAGISLNADIARDGISRKEYQAIVKLQSKDPNLTARLIAQVLCQGYHEFLPALGAARAGKIPELDGNNLLCMVESILCQRKRLNPLATRNQLMISLGIMRDKKKIIDDAGIKRRGDSSLLLYDRYGRAIAAYIGYMDVYYRNLDLDKVPCIKVTVGTSFEGQFLRVLEQTFAFPQREMYVFFASYAEFYGFIHQEIVRLYDGEISKKVHAMLPMAIGFFLVLSVLAAMAKRGNPYAAVLVVAAKAWGWIMNIDMGLTVSKNLQTAGFHYGQMEVIHRRQPKEKGKPQLTTLSLYHLEQGTRSLITAMSDVLAMGIFFVGGKAAGKVGAPAADKTVGFAADKLGRLSKWVKASRADAKVEVHLNADGKIEKIRAIDGKPAFEIETVNASGGTGKAMTKPLEVVPGAEAQTVVVKPAAPAAGAKPAPAQPAAGGKNPPANKQGGDVVPITKAKGWKGSKAQKDAIEQNAKAGQGKGGTEAKPGGAKDPGQKPEVIPLKRPHKRYDAPPSDETLHGAGRSQKSQPGGNAKRVSPTEYKDCTFLQPRGAATEGATGMPTKHLQHAIDVAKAMKRIVLLRTTNPRGVQHVLNGHPPKGKDLIALNTSKTTGKVTARNGKEAAIAQDKGYYILRKNGRAYLETRQGDVIVRKVLKGPDGKPVEFDMKAKGQHGELTNEAGQVIDPKARKAVVGDYDMQDVINPTAPGRNLAAVPSSKGANVTNPEASEFAKQFNAKLAAEGDTARIVHGADAQFMQYKMYGRTDPFKGDVVGIMPDGRVFILKGPQVAKFYREIGRSRLEIPADTQLSPGVGGGGGT